MNGFSTAFRRGAVAAGVLLLAACDGGGGGTTEPEACYVRALDVLPEDTAVILGGSYPVLAQPQADCSARVRFSVASDVAEIDSVSGVLVAKKYGRVKVTVRAENATDTAMVSVVPPGRLAAMPVPAHAIYPDALVLLRTDLTGRRTLAALNGTLESSPAWHPDGDRLYVSYARGSPFPKLYELDLDGAARLMFPAMQAEEMWQSFPQVSASGEWVYFTRQVGHDRFETWRAHPDGTMLERMIPHGTKPGLSPDERYIAFLRVFWERDPINGETVSFIRDMQTGAELPGFLEGNGVKFSPSGAEIAYVWEWGVYVRAFPGGVARRVGPAGTQYSEWVSWSPDGQWLSVHSRTDNRIELIQVSTGLAVPLPSTARLSQPAWAPAAAN